MGLQAFHHSGSSGLLASAFEALVEGGSASRREICPPRNELNPMQRNLRKRHRLMWLLLAPVAMGALIYALANRMEMPVMDEVPDVSQGRGDS